jgi:hypothetical protein
MALSKQESFEPCARVTGVTRLRGYDDEEGLRRVAFLKESSAKNFAWGYGFLRRTSSSCFFGGGSRGVRVPSARREAPAYPSRGERHRGWCEGAWTGYPRCLRAGLGTVARMAVSKQESFKPCARVTGVTRVTGVATRGRPPAGSFLERKLRKELCLGLRVTQQVSTIIKSPVIKFGVQPFSKGWPPEALLASYPSRRTLRILLVIYYA